MSSKITIIINMLDFDKEINTKLIAEINKILKAIGADYKDLSAEMLHLDNSFAFRILNNQNIMRLSTYIKVCNAIISIKNKKGSNISDELLKPSYILSKIGY